MNRYNKLLTEILDSSIWLEGSDTRIIWITLLAAMDKDGFCRFASPANVARRARVSPAAAVAALQKFESPDPLTPEDENQGRRIERVPSGYIVLNTARHRDQVTSEEIRKQTRERVQRFRNKERASTPVTPGNGVTQNVTQDRYTDGDKGTDIKPPVTPDITQSEAVSVSEAKQRQQRGRAAAEALAEETLQQAKALLKGTKAIVDAPLSNNFPSLFPRRD